ncbi:hypothetical protein MINTMi27_15290 [Mycobacterium intracellulare]|uniref:hypothetical protein n=1 Tax=Mycobacterium intracellulare TaxID=1767 RepID=UPI0019296D70|nr:hypothetical protein [Mycobacterium intracellulare]BCP41436.1 hypothetical protein MINTMi27_15290 [Mycobacterium intracellulare]
MSYADLPHLRSNAYSESTAASPSVAAAAGAGASPTITATGFDERGQVSVKVGATGEAAGSLVTVTFAKAYDVAPDAVVVSGNDSASAALNPYASASKTALTIGVAGTPSASATYVFNYVVVGGV